jgi:hypothetical protein
MDLESFIAEALRQLVKGIKAAQQSPDCKGSKIVPATLESRERRLIDYLTETPVKVEFDVAVTVTEGKECGLTVGQWLEQFG